MKGGWVSSEEKKNERERRERKREIWGKIRENGQEPSHIFVQWALGRCDLTAWVPTHLKASSILQHSQRLGAGLGRLGSQSPFFFIYTSQTSSYTYFT